MHFKSQILQAKHLRIGGRLHLEEVIMKNMGKQKCFLLRVHRYHLLSLK